MYDFYEIQASEFGPDTLPCDARLLIKSHKGIERAEGVRVRGGIKALTDEQRKDIKFAFMATLGVETIFT